MVAGLATYHVYVPIMTLRAVRDAAFFALLWACARRGGDVIGFDFSNVYPFGDTREAFGPTWLAACRGEGPATPARSKFYFQPMHTKTERGRRCETIEVEAACTIDLCPLRLLQLLVQGCIMCGVPGAGQGAAFRAYGFADSGVVQTTAMQNRLQAALQDHGLPEDVCAGYTLHSFRRGRLQHEHRAGKTFVELRQLAGLRSDQVLRRYLDACRHLSV